MSSKAFAVMLVASLLSIVPVASTPAAAQAADPAVFSLGFSAPDDATDPSSRSEGTGTLTVPADGMGVALTLEVTIGPLDTSDVFVFLVRDVGSTAGDDTTCPAVGGALLNGAVEQAVSGFAFSGGSRLVRREPAGRTMTANYNPANLAPDGRLSAGEYAMVVVDPNFTIRGCAELSSFAGDLDSATTVGEIQASEDYRADEHGEILGFYRAAFNREPDFDGARYWINTVYEGGLLLDENGQPLTNPGERLQRIAGLFANEGQPEFQALYGDIETDEEFVTAIYRNVLGRAGDADGIAYWRAQLADGLSRAEALRWMALGAEFICGRGAFGRTCPLA